MCIHILEKCELYCGLLFFINMMIINITHYFIYFGNFVSERLQLTVYSQDPSILSEDIDTFFLFDLLEPYV